MPYIECIINCYEHVRDLEYADEPDYELLKTWVEEDLRLITPTAQIGNFDWSRPSIKEQPLQEILVLETRPIE